MILFAAGTGLRPAEWIALEKRDSDGKERVVYVRRSFTRRELKFPKTDASIRAVQMQARALDALDRVKDRQRDAAAVSRRARRLTSTSTTSDRSSGALPRRRTSIRFGGATISRPPSRPSRCVPASLPSTPLPT